MSDRKPLKTEFDGIVVKNAREHNLKGVSVSIPRNQITVITGLSGSGKSSLAFDTIYAEGQRRYIESLSAYARNFLEQLKKPEVDSIKGLSPAIAIDQRTISNNPRSTVGTVTEVYDYLRLLYARVGIPNCPVHKVPVHSQKPEDIVNEIFKKPKGSKFLVLAPVAQSEKGEFLNLFQKWEKKGFVRARVDGEWIELSEAKKLAKHKRHDVELLIDKLVVDEKFRPRLRESLNTALGLADGLVSIEFISEKPQIFSVHRACPKCGYSFAEMEPRLFSFNNPRGACETCSGMGVIGFDEEEISIEEGEDDDVELEIDYQTCPDCKGFRLKKDALNVFLTGKHIGEVSSLSVTHLIAFLNEIQFDERDRMISEKIIQQIQFRLKYMDRVGTGYLSMDRPTRTLSGGEAQRIRLATQVGSALIGVLYVLDEPSIGLHPRDHDRLLLLLRELRDRGNTILLVEHDEDTMWGADHLIDLGPGAGRLGGMLIAAGTPAEVSRVSTSLTGQYLSGKKRIPVPSVRRPGNGQTLSVIGASGNNLKNVDLHLPLNTFISVTGVSGSGKSTLIIDTLFRALAQKFYRSSTEPQAFKKIEGLEQLDRVIQINQKPIGRTPRSTPSTYVGLMSAIRDLYAQLPESKMRGYKPGQFSFNVKSGRCAQCEGAGMVRVEMHFMSDVYVKCDTCNGLRYSPETRSIKFKGKSIADVLNMSVEEALAFFENHPVIRRKLQTLHEVGLDYLTLGQASTTLSGGEAQRIKLSRELSKRGTGKTLYILDEPTTGLHFEDVRKLIVLLQELVNQGNTVLVIEHNMDVIKSSDCIIDLGPDGGDKGGYIVAEGTPETVARVSQSETGKYLKKVLNLSENVNNISGTSLVP